MPIPRAVLPFAFLLITTAHAQQPDKTLWYNRPAEHFEESLVLGNGTLGATVFAGVKSDKIYLNDATLWSGEPVKAGMNPEAYRHVPAIREALKAEDYKLANELNRKFQGKFSESYAPLGTMFLDFGHEAAAQNYRRQSHLFGLFPGHHITPDKTPELAAACRRTLDIKGDETTGWSKGWRINLWARLHDGNRAYKM